MSQPTRVSMSLGSTTRLNEFDFSKISLSLERDLVPAENPVDAYRDIKALLERMVTEFQAGKPSQIADASAKSSANTSAAKSKESPIVSDNHALPPRPAVSKLAALQERLGPRLQNLEVVEGFDGLCVKPKSYLGDRWAQINDVVRSLGGSWVKGQSPKDGSWRIPK